MTSILTNSAAMAALQTLRSIDNGLETTQARVSSGLRVENASDNAAYWSIATTMRSDNRAISTVADALGLGAAKVDTAYAALENVVEVMSEIKAKLVAAREPGVDKNKINDEITELKNQLISAAQSASFSGENWLYNSGPNELGVKSVVASFVRSASGNVKVATLDFDTKNSVLIDISDAERGYLTKAVDADALMDTPTGTAREYYLIDMGAASASARPIEILDDPNDPAATTYQDLDDMISVVDNILKDLTNAASTLGAITKRIEMQESFVASLGDVIDKGIGRLVDADMNEESTRLKALQTQQQLGIQSLSIANSSAENILQLFRQ
ncbi:flagellin N-terminal helical domain-containing protein [Shinella zoogloeoides]|uniref:flagellin N-terminal helical domain-containing protein n=1 Tax=Shinella zoogloeoides TaxID=352475 RepID=UPI00273E1275|nr:flagellin [Shinella zoogloeoides]WLR93136.1 flagellin [Shinella zoogloeoides]